jgi:integrase
MPIPLAKTNCRVAPGLVLKSPHNSANWQAHACVSGQVYRRTTGTSDIKIAKQWALKWLSDLKTNPAAKPAGTVSWTQLTDRYLLTLPEGAKRDYHTDTLTRHFTPVFQAIADIRHITSGLILDYLILRRKKTNPEPLPQTLNRENTVLRQMLKFAVTHELIDKLPVVPFLAEALTRRRRRDFNTDEYMLLRQTAIKRIRHLPADKTPAEQRHIRHQRQLLYDVIQLLANSGLRVDELHSITWRCVDWANGDIILERAGKRRSNRRLVLMRPAVRALLRLAQRRRNWQRLNAEPVLLHSDEKIIALPSGKSVRQLDTGFDLLLKACGFRYSEVINKHALTSLRHTYATRALTRKGTNKISTHVLSLQMGTSERMIRAHYGHDSIEDYREELRG